MQFLKIVALLGLTTMGLAAPAPESNAVAESNAAPLAGPDGGVIAEREAAPVAEPNAAALAEPEASEDGAVLAKRACDFTACKAYGKTQCAPTFSANSGVCINLVSSDGRPFISGHSGRGCRCTIYAGRGCSGRATSVDSAGWSRFPHNAVSVACPYDY